jgi:hypothetical protein
MSFFALVFAADARSSYTPDLPSYFTSFLQMVLSEVVQRFAFLVFFI